jgi:hypothetical protein
MNTSVVQGLEKQLQDAKGLQARRDLVVKLSNNREFRELILDGFCRDDCARFTHQSADPALTPQQRADALAVAQAAGHLKRYLSAAFQMGVTADNQLAELEEALEEARAEEDVPEQIQPDETHGDNA